MTAAAVAVAVAVSPGALSLAAKKLAAARSAQ